MKANGDALITHTDPPSDPFAVAEQLIDGFQSATKRATETAEQAPAMATQAARDTTRKWVLWAVVSTLLVSAGTAWAVSTLFNRLSATEAVVAEQRKQLDDLHAAWVAGNETLASQGRPTVPAPAEWDPTAATVAAVVAQVRANLPANLTGEDVQQIVDRTLLTQPPGPQGIGVTAIRPATRGGNCVLVATLRNPGNGAISESVSAPISPALCDPAAGHVTTTMTPAPTPTTTPAPSTEAPKPSSTPDDEPQLPDIPN